MLGVWGVPGEQQQGPGRSVPCGAIVLLQAKELPHVMVLSLFHVPGLNTVIMG